MSCKCNQTPCCCRKRFTGNRDVKLIPGPQGEQGPQGPPGANGQDGAPGAAGGMQFETFYQFTEGAIWNPIETAWIGTSYVITGGDGDYQIHVDTMITAEQGNEGTIRLYVDGVNVDERNIQGATVGVGVETGVTVFPSFNWRGNILNGATVEIRQFLTLPQIGVNGINSVKGSILINKEA